MPNCPQRILSRPCWAGAVLILAKLWYKVTILESMPVLGGKLRWAILDYRLPKKILDQEIEKILSLGIRVRKKAKVGRDIPFEDLKRYQAVFIATGVQRSLPLGLPGEGSKNGASGLDFLKSSNLGEEVSLGLRPVVVGGGNTAIDVARSCLRLGSSPVILYRRSKQEMPAYKDEVEEAEREGIPIRYRVAPIRIIREKGRVTGLEGMKMRMGKPDPPGSGPPIPIRGSKFFVETDQVIRAIGETADRGFLSGSVRSADHLISTSSQMATSHPGVFAGGDAIAQPSSVGPAIL